MRPEAKALMPSDIRVGLTAEFQREVTQADIEDFARNSGDFNPLHVDAEYAAHTNYGGCIAHGAFQIGLASALLGMHLPGRHVLLGATNGRFSTPLYPPCTVLVRGEVTAWNLANRAGQLRVTILDAQRRIPYSEIGMTFTFHGAATTGAPNEERLPRRAEATGKTVLVTGASGGIGTEIVSTLTAHYQVLALAHRQPISCNLRDLANVVEVRADLNSNTWAHAVLEALGDQTLFAVVHAAWPGMPRGGLLENADDVLQQQLTFGAVLPVRLARLLISRVAADGGRLILLGSTAGAFKPVLGTATYSLGKAALEHTVRLLAPELARKQITVNAICPSYVPAGLNKQAEERQQKLEAARVPLGRLCSPTDIAGAISYLLSPAASFISGQVLHLTGGQL